MIVDLEVQGREATTGCTSSRVSFFFDENAGAHGKQKLQLNASGRLFETCFCLLQTEKLSIADQNGEPEVSIVLKPTRVDSDQSDFEAMAISLLGKEVCYGWPQSQYGRVTAIFGGKAYFQRSEDGTVEKKDVLIGDYKAEVQQLTDE